MLTAMIESLIENPTLLIPLLLIIGVVLFAVLKRLLKLLAIVVIAGTLYVLLVNYIG